MPKYFLKFYWQFRTHGLNYLLKCQIKSFPSPVKARKRRIMPAPVISIAQMREWEKATWNSGQSEEIVMRQAGQAVARQAERMTRPRDLILVLAGQGHNGDDARYAAEYLEHREVEVVAVENPKIAVAKLLPLLARHPALIIDGLFGIGLNRPLGEDWLNLIQTINHAARPVLAVDVPSGLNANTGEPMNDAIRAAVTVTFGAAKEGLLKSSAWPFVGRLEIAPNIGLIDYPFTTEINVVNADDFRDFPPPRPEAGHKGTFGHLAIVAGSLGYHGASVLCARGAQRAQPGLITLLTAPNVFDPVAQQLQAVMVRPWTEDLSLVENCSAVLAGPGLAAPDVPDLIKELIRLLWQGSSQTVVADASALAWLPPGPIKGNALRLITPHPGEAARLLDVSAAEIQNDRPRFLRELSQKFGDCYVVLKGHQTVIGNSSGDLWINCSGNPHLAQGGSGDLLSGFVSGLLAQPYLQVDPMKAIAYAVWEHGAAADYLQANRKNWIIEDLAELIGNVG
jgi:ADP-dependent NAD(P)H-hydrate dehydratase / NAD(P)H-hydrate epimerase